MRKTIKRICSLMLALVMVASLLPMPQKAQAAELSSQAYAAADSLFDQFDVMERQMAKRNPSQSQVTDAAAEIVMASDSYVEDSLVRNGDSFTWWTEDGIRCIYSPRLREIKANMKAEDAPQDVIVNEPTATRGGMASGNQVYLVGPYYGYDNNFTNQYKNEAQRAAIAIGDTDGYTLYSGKAATVDKVAEAVSNGAVVFFDSHGTTDYENPDDEYDFVTGATSSYMCINSTAGLTNEDYNDGALYSDDGMACINGAIIANHMTKSSPGGIVWMALCLGMATDTLCQPLRKQGVEVVYGYSQSVSFDGDYLYEATFWNEMFEGNTVADAVATMKDTWGDWEWSTKMASYYGENNGYSTISSARNDYMSFPIVVSDEDAHPGQRNGSFYGACSLQTVQSTYQLNVVADVPETPEEPSFSDLPAYNTALKTGDQVVIYAPAYGKALSTEKIATHYNVGVDLTVVNDVLYGYSNLEIWTVTANADGTYCFANGGQNIAMADQYTSMNLGEKHDKWQLISLGDGLYNVKNVGRNCFMEWYDSKNNWSAYTSANGDQFELSLYVIGKGVLNQTVDVPEQPDTPETPDVPQLPAEDGAVISIADAIAAGAAMAHNNYTELNYKVTGEITEVYNTQYGNMKIKDEAGNILTIYGTYDATGEIRYDALDVKPVAGDTVTIYGPVGQYNGAPQIKNGWIVAHTPAGGTTPEEPEDPIPDEPENPDTPVTGDGVLELTVDSLGIANETYYTGDATVDSIALDLTQIGNYGNGVQMRDKDGKTSILFNTTALPGKVTKIELTYSATMEVKYANPDAVIFSFGTAQDDLTYSTKLSTEIGEKSYTITPEGDFTYFHIEHDLGYTLYWDSIKVYYDTEGGSDFEEAVPGDLSGDGTINTLDGLLLMHYLNGWDEEIPSEAAMDVNRDGKVDTLDGLLLMHYLNGWDVTLG